MNDDFRELSNIVNYLIDSRVGIISKIFEKKHANRFNHFYHFCAKVCDVSVFCQQKNFSHSNGIGLNKDRALAKAIGEAIERYCSAIYIKNNLYFSNIKNADFSCINCLQFPYFEQSALEEHSKFKGFNECSQVYWTSSKNLMDNKEVFVPASLVYLPYKYDEKEDKIFQNISTGLACHTDLTRAIISGVCEVIERDAFMLFWKNRISPPQIKIDTLPERIRRFFDLYKRDHFKINLFYTTTDLEVPSVIVTLRSHSVEHPAFVMAAACKPSLEEAILSAIEELEMTRDYVFSKYKRAIKIEISEIKNQEDHLMFWSKHENLNRLDFLFNCGNFISYTSSGDILEKSNDEILKKIIQVFKSLNIDIFWSDITSSDIHDLGLRVVRVIIPKLSPLFFGYKNDQYISDRILNFGVDKIFDYIPHPFP
jgi:ribosomal protein S12 methylthiotransferase accessory factor